MKKCLLFCLLSLIAAGCASLKPSVTEIEARFTNEKPHFIKVVEAHLASVENPAYFDNEDILFTSVKLNKPGDWKYILNKSSNGGKTYQSLEIPTPEDAGLHQSLFINPSTGWLILGNNPNQWDPEHKTWLMKTDDAGKTWRILKTSTQTTFEQIFFTDEKNGWMIANLSNLEPSVVTRPLIYRTTDGGETWTDTSEKLRKFYEYKDGSGSVVDFFVESAEKVKVATHDRKLFQTEDGGKTWRRFGPDFSFLPAQTGIAHLGTVGESSRLRSAAGSWTTEGHFCYLASEEKDGTWKLRWIREGLTLFDVLYLSENEVLISGFIQKSLLNEDWENQTGVVYYSADGGDTFSTVYQSSKTRRFGVMKKLTDNRVVVFGENGFVLNLEIQNPAG